jgi:SAM-dependent methyltransferase
MAVYDEVAACYDDSRGGERRGDRFAAELDRRLPAGDGPILDVGVGTGVVALGLRRRGRDVVGVDVSAGMLARAAGRLGPTVVRGDALRLPFRPASVAHAVSVWVVHHVDRPQCLFPEVAMALRPQGRFVVCPTTRSLDDDPIEPILGAMLASAARRNPSRQPRQVSATDIAGWGAEAGFSAHIDVFEGRTSVTTAAELAHSIRRGAWPVLSGLDEEAFRAVTGPALEALSSLPGGPIVRRAHVDMVVLQRT